MTHFKEMLKELSNMSEDDTMSKLLRSVAETDEHDMSVQTLVQTSKTAVEIVKQSAYGRKLVATAHSASGFKMPPINLADEIKRIVEAAGVKARDLSDELHSHMTYLDLAKWNYKKNLLLMKHPDTVFFVTCDLVKTHEILLCLDAETKRAAMLAFTIFEGDAQGLAWRGEDYVRISGLGTVVPVQSLAQHMKTLTEPDRECVICLEKMNELKQGDWMHAGVMGYSNFTCMHSICHRCSNECRDKEGKTTLTECPVCRCTNTMSAAIESTRGNAKKNKKKKRAEARRGRKN